MTLTVTEPTTSTAKLLALQIDEEQKNAKEPYFLNVAKAILFNVLELHLAAFEEEPTIKKLATYVWQSPEEWAKTLNNFEEIANMVEGPQRKLLIKTALDLARGDFADIRNMSGFQNTQMTCLSVLQTIILQQKTA